VGKAATKRNRRQNRGAYRSSCDCRSGRRPNRKRPPEAGKRPSPGVNLALTYCAAQRPLHLEVYADKITDAVEYGSP
jgi:hypothetical protein